MYLKIKYRIKTREIDRMMASALIIVITLTQQSSPVCIAMEFFFVYQKEKEGVITCAPHLPPPPPLARLIVWKRVLLHSPDLLFCFCVYERERERESLKQSNMQIFNEMIISFIRSRWGWGWRTLLARAPETVPQKPAPVFGFVFCFLLIFLCAVQSKWKEKELATTSPLSKTHTPLSFAIEGRSGLC